MKIRVDKALDALNLENRHQLSQWLGMKNHQAVYQWGEYMPELRAYQAVRKHPDLERLIES